MEDGEIKKNRKHTFSAVICSFIAAVSASLVRGKEKKEKENGKSVTIFFFHFSPFSLFTSQQLLVFEITPISSLFVTQQPQILS